MTGPTDRQVGFVRVLQRKLHLPDTLLDNHTIATYGAPFAAITVAQCSELIDTLLAWEQVPAELQRLTGQLDLFGATS